MQLQQMSRQDRQVATGARPRATTRTRGAPGGGTGPTADGTPRPAALPSCGDNAAYLHGLDSPAVIWLRLNERNVVMQQAAGSKGGWLGSGVWAWTVISQLVMVVLVVVTAKLLEEQP